MSRHSCFNSNKLRLRRIDHSPRMLRGTSQPQSDARLEVSLHLDAILFESDNVLYDASAWWRWFSRLISSHGVYVDHDTLCEIWKRDYLPSTKCGCGRWQALCDLLESIGIDKASIQEIHLAARPKWREFESGLRPLPGVVQTISQLNARQIKLAVMNTSGRNGAEFADQLARLQMDRCFSFQFTMDQITPSPTEAHLLNFAGNLLGHAGQVIAIVGKYRTTLETAKQLGWLTISCQGWPEILADVWIPTINALTDVVCPRVAARRAG